ncbi:MAG: cobaltochelatase subunit CobN, partial [Methylococcales bacterium]
MDEINTSSITLLTHAPNDLMVLQSALLQLPEDFPSVNSVNLQAIDSETQITRLLTEGLASTQIFILRILGRLGSVQGLSRLLRHVRERKAYLIVVSGTGEPDPELTAVSTVAPDVLQQVLNYFQAGGSVNLAQLLRYLSDHLLLTGFGFEAAKDLPEHGLYHPDLAQGAGVDEWLAQSNPDYPSVGIIFYRSHWMSGNTGFIDALINALEQRNINVLPIFTSSLRVTDDAQALLPTALGYFCKNQRVEDVLVDVLINTTSFAMSEITNGDTTLAGWSVGALEQLNVPVLQAITSGMLFEQWQQSTRGLNPLDAAMNVI